MNSPSFTPFDDFAPPIYEEEVEQRWGNTDAYEESARRTKHYSNEDWQQIKAENASILNAIVNLMKKNIDPNDQAATSAVDAYRQHIDRWYYPCSKTMFVGLANMYIEDQRFKNNFDKIEKGLAQYIYNVAVCDRK